MDLQKGSKNTMTAIQSIINKQKTIDMLLTEGSLEFGRGGVSNKWQIQPIYEDKDCSMGLVHIDKVESGPCEEHIHPGCREYLIVVKGSVLLNVEGRDVRVVNEGECAAVGAGIAHFSRPLEDGTKLAYITVPNDTTIPALKIGNTEVMGEHRVE